MWLIVDDERTLGCEIVTRTAHAGIQILKALYPDIECLCIDFDLGDPDPEKTGDKVIINAIAFGCLPNKVQIVTMNPVGRQVIAAILHNHNYLSNDGINFVNKYFS